jgi:tRNA(Phe) wybutosine-synthesizing methylase Tyw3
MVAVDTPRGRIEVMQQEMRGLRQGSRWRMFWFARRAGKQEWAQANTPQEAIRKATLLPPKKAVGWLEKAGEDVRNQLDGTNVSESDRSE